MPSGKTHDAITFLLAPPVFAAAYSATGTASLAIAVTTAFLFGSLMFGPDLDTVSKQYSRWMIFRVFWLPYRTVFNHRSRWSHGLIFGTLFRVVYFMGALSLAALAGFVIKSFFLGGTAIGVEPLASAWQQFGELIRSNLGNSFLPGAFIGMWTGAASHTFTDMAGTYIKTGRVTEFL